MAGVRDFVLDVDRQRLVLSEQIAEEEEDRVVVFVNTYPYTASTPIFAKPLMSTWMNATTIPGVLLLTAPGLS